MATYWPLNKMFDHQISLKMIGLGNQVNVWLCYCMSYIHCNLYNKLCFIFTNKCSNWGRGGPWIQSWYTVQIQKLDWEFQVSMQHPISLKICLWVLSSKLVKKSKFSPTNASLINALDFIIFLSFYSLSHQSIQT